jgi:CBS domain-containing protein
MAKITVSDLNTSLDTESLMMALTDHEIYSVKGGDHYYVIVDNNGKPVGVLHVKD